MHNQRLIAELGLFLTAGSFYIDTLNVDETTIDRIQINPKSIVIKTEIYVVFGIQIIKFFKFQMLQMILLLLLHNMGPQSYYNKI